MFLLLTGVHASKSERAAFIRLTASNHRRKHITNPQLDIIGTSIGITFALRLVQHNENGNLMSPSSDDNGGMKLWLDLRGTALLPSAAIEYLKENVDDGFHSSSVIDRVVLSEASFEALLSQDDDQQPENRRDVMYAPSQGDELILSSYDNQQSLPCGKFIRSKKGLMFNPIQALDIIMTKGGWICMEKAPESEDKDWFEEVASLLSLLMASSSSSLGQSLGGDTTTLLDSTSNTDTTTKPAYVSAAGRGLAIACSTASLLMDIGKLYLQQTSLKAGTTTSPGGILLPANKSCSNSVLDYVLGSLEGINGFVTHAVDDDRLSIAVLLPLDIQLWKTAIDLISDSSEISNSSDFR